MSGARIYLIRHAKSSWDDEALPDHARPLSERGVRDARRFGRWLAAGLPAPDAVLCSDARRTRDTLAAFVPDPVDPRRVFLDGALYHASGATLLERLRTLGDEVRTAWLVGHNPGISDLARRLCGADEALLADLPTFGVAGVALPDGFTNAAPGVGRLVALLAPKILPGTDGASADGC